MKLHHTTPKHLFCRLPILLPMVAALSFPLQSCNMTQGAAAGALIGAGLGQLAGGDTEATIAGAVIGGAVGAAIGHNVEKKREARVLASRQATQRELEAAALASKSISDEARAKAIASAEAYEAEHGHEYDNPGTAMVMATKAAPTARSQGEMVVSAAQAEPEMTMDAETPDESASSTPMVELTDPAQPGQDAAVEAPMESPAVEPVVEPTTIPAPAEKHDQLAASTEVLEPVLVEAVALPNGEGHVLRDLRTGDLISEDVHVIDQTMDVSGAQSEPVHGGSEDAPLPFTLILKDKATGKNRQYTAIYSA